MSLKSFQNNLRKTESISVMEFLTCKSLFHLRIFKYFQLLCLLVFNLLYLTIKIKNIYCIIKIN